MREGTERLLEIPHGLAVGRPCHGLLPRLPAVRQGLVPHLAPQGMVRQAFDLLGHPVPGEGLQGLDNARVQRPPSLLQEASVCHLVGQGVLEGVLALGKEPCLVEELGRLEVREATMQHRLGHLGNGLQQRQGHVRADDRGALQEVLVLQGQAVDASGQHRLHRGGHLQALDRLRQAIRATLTGQDPGLYQGAPALLQEERVALSPCDQQALEGLKAGVVAEEGLQECPGAGGRQRVEPQLCVVGLAAPTVLIFRAVVDQQQDAGPSAGSR